MKTDERGLTAVPSAGGERGDARRDAVTQEQTAGDAQEGASLAADPRGRRHRPGHRGVPRLPAVRQGRPAGRRVRVSRSASSTAPWSSRRRTSSRPSTAARPWPDGGLVISAQPSLTNTMLTMFIITALLLVADAHLHAAAAPRSRAGSRTSWSGASSRSTTSRTAWAAPQARALRAHVHLLLRAHPRLQLERPGAAHRARSSSCARPPAT